MKPRYETTKINHPKYETEGMKPRMKPSCETTGFEGLKRMFFHTFETPHFNARFGGEARVEPGIVEPAEPRTPSNLRGAKRPAGLERVSGRLGPLAPQSQRIPA